MHLFVWSTFCHLNYLSCIEPSQHFICHHHCQVEKRKYTFVGRNEAGRHDRVLKKLPFRNPLQHHICSPSATMPDVNHNLENQNMFQYDVTEVRRYSLRPTWSRNSIFGYLGDTLDTANSECEGWSSFICSSLAVRTRRWWQLLSPAIYGTDRWMNGSRTISAVVLWNKRIIIQISWWHLVLFLKLNYILPVSVVFLFLFRIN